MAGQPLSFFPPRTTENKSRRGIRGIVHALYVVEQIAIRWLSPLMSGCTSAIKSERTCYAMVTRRPSSRGVHRIVWDTPSNARYIRR